MDAPKPDGSNTGGPISARSGAGRPLRQGVRAGPLVARLGGDELAFVLRGPGNRDGVVRFSDGEATARG